MSNLERSLDSLSPSPAGDLPPAVCRGLRTIRIQRRVLGGAAVGVALAALSALPAMLMRPPAPTPPPHPGIASAPPELTGTTLVALTRANQDPDPEQLRLPPTVRAGSAIRAGSTDAMAAELGLQ